MKSLLSKELETYNSNSVTFTNINNNNKFQIYNLDKKKVSEVVDKKQIECKLNINNFDPMKNSPPNDWQLRLENRLKNIDNKIIIQCKI